MARIALMLWSVREQCARDLEGTLRAVAALGYEGVEPFDLHGHDAAEVRAWLDELDLVACGRHAGLDALEGELDRLADESATLGIRRLVVSWADPLLIAADAGALADRLAADAERVAARGLELGFHNHDAEVAPLADGRTFVDLVLARGLFLEPDLGWAWFAGADPEELLGRARGRCPLVHVKDFASRDDRGSFRPVGDGSVGYERVAPAAVDAGADWLIVEQDETGGDPIADAGRSLAALRGML